MAVDLDHFTVARRGTGEDITAIAGRYGRDCLARGATVGGDAEARRRAPEDVAAFLRRVLKPETHRRPPGRLLRLPRESLLSFLSNDVVREVAMAQEAYDPERGAMSRRTMLRSVGAAVGAAVLAPRLAGAQTPPIGPPSTITPPPRDFSPRGAPTTYLTHPDVLTVEPAFNGLRQPNAPIQRLWTGALCAEGPAR